MTPSFIQCHVLMAPKLRSSRVMLFGERLRLRADWLQMRARDRNLQAQHGTLTGTVGVHGLFSQRYSSCASSLRGQNNKSRVCRNLSSGVGVNSWMLSLFFVFFSWQRKGRQNLNNCFFKKNNFFTTVMKNVHLGPAGRWWWFTPI